MLFWTLIAAALLLGLLYIGRGYLAWVLALTALTIGGYAHGAVALALVATVVGATIAVLFARKELRERWVSARLLEKLAAALPRIGETERIALEAGTVWWDGELFSGQPDWRRLLEFKVPALSAAERDFLQGPVEELCTMLNDWDIAQARDLPEPVWSYLKQQGFFGMIIPENYGGKGFSALAHSAVVTKIASRSIAAAVTVMVPNSLGPAELLLHYGTDEQRDHHLPRLARGEDLPCFALTGPEAGSDAAATQSSGRVMRGDYEGREVTGILLNWRKRYITLAPVATLIGLAFKLYDPEHLLGEEEDLGITCALIPRHLAGIEIGERHDPMGIPFTNGPTVGRDVFVPIDFIIGGRERAGQGWRMLMDSLAAGRCISLPALSVAAAQIATRVVGAYGTVREQFDTPIGRFEGVEEPLARIGGHTYWMSAARRLSCAAVDAGEKPAVVSAIVKAYLTEGMRQVVTDAMDIRAGSGIMRGPRNVLSRTYTAIPIAITVEGANILTRSMIVYGQGAIRCHPFVHAEIEAIGRADVAALDTALFGHLNFYCRNLARTLLLGLSGSRLARAPIDGPTAGYFRSLSRMSAAFALASDACLMIYGGRLKRKEKVSGRLTDALAWMYLASSALKQFEDDARPHHDLPLVRWSAEHALHQIQNALLGVFDNLPNRLVGSVLKRVTFPFGPRFRPPGDRLGAEVARGLLEDREARRALTRDIYLPPKDELGLGRLEAALDKAVEALRIETKLRDAVRAGSLDHAPGDLLAREAQRSGIIDAEELEALEHANEIRDEVVQVDAFDPEVYRQLR